MKPGLEPKDSFVMLVLKAATDRELARRRWKEHPAEGDRYSKGLGGRQKQVDVSYLQSDHEKP